MTIIFKIISISCYSDSVSRQTQNSRKIDLSEEILRMTTFLKPSFRGWNSWIDTGPDTLGNKNAMNIWEYTRISTWKYMGNSDINTHDVYICTNH